MKRITPSAIIIVSVAIAAIGFMFVHNTHMDAGYNTAVIGMVQIDGIPLTESCAGNWDDPSYCGISIPYRWLLTVCIAAIAYALIWHRSRSHTTPVSRNALPPHSN
jgi:hypothetical protein